MDNNKQDNNERAEHEIRTEFLERGGEFFLIIKVPGEPDAVGDVEKALDIVKPREILNCDKLLLIGANKTVEIDKHLVLNMIHLTEERDDAFILDTRKRIDPNYGYLLVDRVSHLALLMRIPRDDVSQATPIDIDSLMSALESEPDKSFMDEIASVYLVADRSYRRLNPLRFFDEGLGLDQRLGVKPIKHEPSPIEKKPGEIIIGVSEEEIVELAYKHLSRSHKRIMRDVEVFDGSGISYHLDLVGVDDERTIAKYIESPDEDDINLMELLIEGVKADRGVILTNKKPEVDVSKRVEIITADEL